VYVNKSVRKIILGVREREEPYMGLQFRILKGSVVFEGRLQRDKGAQHIHRDPRW